MTCDERVKAIAITASTERARRASCDRHAALRGGCLGHYSASRGYHGQKVQDFFRKVVARKYATARRWGHNRPALPLSSQADVRSDW